jgi:hypothetical protein
MKMIRIIKKKILKKTKTLKLCMYKRLKNLNSVLSKNSNEATPALSLYLSPASSRRFWHFLASFGQKKCLSRHSCPYASTAVSATKTEKLIVQIFTTLKRTMLEQKKNHMFHFLNSS